MDLASTIGLLEKLAEAHAQNQLAEAQRFKAKAKVAKAQQAVAKLVKGNKRNQKDPNAPKKQKKDSNEPKKLKTSFIIFYTDDFKKIKEENPTYSICDVGKEAGRCWAVMEPALKQQYQARAEVGRQKYNVDMADYRQRNATQPTLPTNLQQ